MRCCVVWKLNLLQVHRHYICSRPLHSFHHSALHYRHDTRRIVFLCAACCRVVWRTDQVPVVDAAQTTFPICASSKRPNARVLRHRQHIFGIGRFRYSEWRWRLYVRLKDQLRRSCWFHVDGVHALSAQNSHFPGALSKRLSCDTTLHSSLPCAFAARRHQLHGSVCKQA